MFEPTPPPIVRKRTPEPLPPLLIVTEPRRTYRDRAAKPPVRVAWTLISLLIVPSTLVVCGLIGVFASQYFPVLGGSIAQIARPGSPCRISLIIPHVVLFAISGAVLSGMALAFAKYMTK